MSSAFIVGVGSTPFRRWPERDFRDLAREALTAALSDAGMDGRQIQSAAFGNCALDTWGQSNIRGQVVLTPMLRDGTLDERLPITNVEGGCVTGSLAFFDAWKTVLAGRADVALALGVEKVFHPDDPSKTFGVFAGGVDQLHKDEWRTFFDEQGERTGHRFEPHPARVMFLDIHALQARAHMEAYGTTTEHLAAIAAKNHVNGVHNDKAQYRTAMTPDQVLVDKPVVHPFTRSMCSPISDGAAAVLVVSARWLARQPQAVQDRAIAIRGGAITGGAWRDLEAPAVVHHAASSALADAGIGGDDIDIVECHDSTAYCELVATEALGLCERGEGGPLALSGATKVGGATPVNPSGGLESKGHPLGATGLGMLDELVVQLRGEGGPKQAGAPTIGVQQNAGGLVGYDEALCSVVVLERRR